MPKSNKINLKKTVSQKLKFENVAREKCSRRALLPFKVTLILFNLQFFITSKENQEICFYKQNWLLLFFKLLLKRFPNTLKKENSLGIP